MATLYLYVESLGIHGLGLVRIFLYQLSYNNIRNPHFDFMNKLALTPVLSSEEAPV